MHGKRFVGLLSLALLVLFWPVAPHPTSAQVAAYSLTRVTVLPNLAAFDIGWVDPSTHHYLLADRSSSAVDVFSTRDGSLLNQFGGFVGNTGNFDTSGPNGVLVTPDTGQIWAGDGNSTVKVLDPISGAIIASISTGGKNRADEMAYDAADHLLAVANDADKPPYLSFISTQSDMVVGKVTFADATAGLEQPVWDPASDRIFQAVPATKTNAGGEIAVIDPLAMQVVKTYALTNCNPAGLADGPAEQFVIGCTGDPRNTQILDGASGKVVATIPQVGGSDEVWYNPGDNHYYVAASGMTSTGTAKGTITPVLVQVQDAFSGIVR